MVTTAAPKKTKLIRFGHSPDPDDAFMFYAFAKKKIPMKGFQVEHVIEDIQTLNQRALREGEFENVGPLEVTAVSCHAYALLADEYAVMSCGASVGDKYGPILVSPKKGSPKIAANPSDDLVAETVPKKGDRLQKVFPAMFKGKRIAVPGKLTTAYLVLQLYAQDFIPVFTPFDKIFDAVKTGKADFGLVIHEGQITWAEKGLVNLVDLGKWWYAKYKLPLPLGVDVIRRDLGQKVMKDFTRLFKASIVYALKNRKPALQYALQYGRGIKENLNDQFVAMYVNDYTVNLGKKGILGFKKLLDEGFKHGILPQKIKLDFVQA